MAVHNFSEESIFHIARRMDAADLRADYLQQACGTDTALLARVEALLAVHEQEQQFLKSAAAEPAQTVDHASLIERPGSTIGRYRLMEQVGEGGMGVVFVAEQERPVRRKVALKIVKPGMDTNEVIARFEAERQALALMDHPNIAKVLDAGSTESSRPYFVMELVRGIAITEYCDRNKLTIRERLELFIEVCQAIQHAHQKGVIHRDLKPSNILVTLHDGKPVPKVIDFGVAKATNQRLTERTIYTRFAQIIGTPMYMSPEQAELSGLDVDTRSDIYSLGVLLYELLTGTTPFDNARFEKAAYDEIRRIVREEEPPKPSTKISTLGETATSVSAHRATDPNGLARLIRGDLDIVAMKALEKDRTRRYDTASNLAADVQRFLDDEPIIARSPSLAYRFTKFASRNRVAVVTSAFVLTSLVMGIVATSWTAQRAWAEKRNAIAMSAIAKDARERAENEAQRANQTLKMLAEASYGEAVAAALANDPGRAQAAMVVASEAGIPPIDVSVLEGLMELNRGHFDKAVAHAEQALADETLKHDSRRIAPLALLGAASGWAGYIDRFEEAINGLRHLTPRSDPEHLLKAYAMVLPDPEIGLRLLKEAPRVQHSTVGLFIRGQAELFIGIDRKNADRLDNAIQDFGYVQFLFQNNQAAVAWRTYAIAAAIELARLQERREDETRLFKLGGAAAQELSGLERSPMNDSCRYHIYRAIGELENAIRAAREAGSHGGGYCANAAIAFLGHFDPAIAAGEFENAVPDRYKDTKEFRLCKGLLAAAGSERAEKVYELVEDSLKGPSGFQRHSALFVLCFVSSSDRIAELADQAIGSGATKGYYEEGVFCPTMSIEYLAGRKPESDFLREVENHGYATATAHCAVAMKRLSQRDRLGAREHFAKAVATNTINSWDYEFARACLARMDADSGWPRWLEDKAAK